MEILIVGTGALASLFAARLGLAGQTVSMLGTWQAGLEALRSQGARLVGADGSEQAVPVHATADPAELRGARFALGLVKAWQTERAARQLAECLAGDGLALSLQNGLGNREILARELGPGRAALGVTTTGATLLGPGLARPGGEGKTSLEQKQALAPLAGALGAAHFHIETVPDAESLAWGKLVVNAAINPLTAILRIPNGELLQHPPARKLMGGLAREAAAVAAAEGIRLPFANPAQAAEEVARQTAANHSSMLQDLLRGAPTEIDAICGAVVERAQAHGTAVPINRACWRLVRALAGKP
jgi:2-dehydropantoate 2-reductase